MHILNRDKIVGDEFGPAHLEPLMTEIARLFRISSVPALNASLRATTRLLVTLT